VFPKKNLVPRIYILFFHSAITQIPTAVKLNKCVYLLTTSLLYRQKLTTSTCRDMICTINNKSCSISQVLLTAQRLYYSNRVSSTNCSYLWFRDLQNTILAVSDTGNEQLVIIHSRHKQFQGSIFLQWILLLVSSL